MPSFGYTENPDRIPGHRGPHAESSIYETPICSGSETRDRPLTRVPKTYLREELGRQADKL